MSMSELMLKSDQQPWLMSNELERLQNEAISA
jgi:hypothetical protein